MALVLVGEDQGHFEVISGLIDVRLAQRLPWLREEGAKPEWARAWMPRADGRPWHTRHEVIGDWAARWPHDRVHGRGEGEEYLVVRKVLVALARLHPEATAIVLAHDVDRRPARREGHRNARNAASLVRPVVLALPEPEIEAWLVALARDDSSAKDRSRELVADIGFNPILEPHRLTSRVRGGNRDAKSIRLVLLGEREVDDVIRNFGRRIVEQIPAACGLADFLSELDAALEGVFDESELEPRE